MLFVILLVVNILFFALTVLFLYESIREKEPRAPKIGLALLSGLVLLARSPLARRFFPHIDNAIYGKKWMSRPVPAWVDCRGSQYESK